MKRKPNKPQQEPRERPGSWEEPADPGGASSGDAGGGSPGGAGTEDTSGQSVHKSKFRQKSKQEQAAASKLRMEKRGEKLEAARGKLAKQKPPKKPGPVRRVGRAAGGTVHGFVHGKIYENEQEKQRKQVGEVKTTREGSLPRVEDKAEVCAQPDPQGRKWMSSKTIKTKTRKSKMTAKPVNVTNQNCYPGKKTSTNRVRRQVKTAQKSIKTVKQTTKKFIKSH